MAQRDEIVKGCKTALLTDVLAEGAKRARVVAKETMDEIYTAMGLLKLPG